MLKLILALCFILPYPLSAEEFQQIIGVIASQNTPVEIKSKTLDGKIIIRSVLIGQPVYLNDEINTQANNKIQILLKDQTAFSIGANSSIVIDKFVFDPNKPELTANIKQGVFKFVSGKISDMKKDTMKVSIPNSVITVRGTSVVGSINPDGSSTVVLLHGSIGLKNANNSIDITKSGFGAQINSTGVISQPLLIPETTIKEITTTIEAKVSNSKESENQMTKDSKNLSSSAVVRNLSNSGSFVLATGNEIQMPVTPLSTITQTASSNARTIASALSSLPSGYISLIPSDYLSYLYAVGANNNWQPDDSSNSQGTSRTRAEVDAYYLQNYLTDVQAGTFDGTQRLIAINSSFNNYTLNLSTNNSNYTSARLFQLNNFHNLNTLSPIPIGIYNFSMPIPGLSSGFDLNPVGPTNSVGYNAGGNMLSHVVSLNFNTSTLSNTYVVSYTYGGTGTSVNQITVNLAGSATSAFSSLTGTNHIINLPVDSAHTQLHMLASFFKDSTYMKGVFNTNIIQQIGDTTSISLERTYSSNGYCASGVTCN